MGAYLSKLGLRYEAVEYITSASPDTVTWLSAEDAKQVGIEVRVLPESWCVKPWCSGH
jgi:hypothetical protein